MTPSFLGQAHSANPSRLPDFLPNTNHKPRDDATRLTILTILHPVHTEGVTRRPTDFLPVSIPRRTTIQRTDRSSLRREGSSQSSLLFRRPAPLTTDKLRVFLASSSGPETPERRVGSDLVCGHVRNLCGGHGCVILQARHQVRVFTRSRVGFRADAFRAPSASSHGLWSKPRSGWRLGARPLTTSQNLRVAGHLSLAISNAFFPHLSI